jgi:NAD(P)-dependent dehydrogenase (short-subunit alcohol dehydrogenase family)
VNAVCPGIIDAPMMDGFTCGTEEGRAGAVAQEPVVRIKAILTDRARQIIEASAFGIGQPAAVWLC